MSIQNDSSVSIDMTLAYPIAGGGTVIQILCGSANHHGSFFLFFLVTALFPVLGTW